jgi:hypothetical protein
MLGTENPAAYALLKVFNKVTDFMCNREILPGEKGVVYQYENTSILWAFENFEYSQKGIKTISNVLDDKSIKLKDTDTFKASRLGVYKISLG